MWTIMRGEHAGRNHEVSKWHSREAMSGTRGVKNKGGRAWQRELSPEAIREEREDKEQGRSSTHVVKPGQPLRLARAIASFREDGGCVNGDSCNANPSVKPRH